MPFASNSVSDRPDTLTEQPSCLHCAGRGWVIECTGPVFPRDFTRTVCPCCGTDEDRIEIEDNVSALAVIEEFQGIDIYTDQRVFKAVRHKLGHNAFIDDALALMAEEYQRRARQAQRVKNHNHRVRTARHGGLH